MLGFHLHFDLIWTWWNSKIRQISKNTDRRDNRNSKVLGAEHTDVSKNVFSSGLLHRRESQVGCWEAGRASFCPFYSRKSSSQVKKTRFNWERKHKWSRNGEKWPKICLSAALKRSFFLDVCRCKDSLQYFKAHVNSWHVKHKMSIN